MIIYLGLLEDQEEHGAMFAKLFTEDCKYKFSISKKWAKMKLSINGL